MVVQVCYGLVNFNPANFARMLGSLQLTYIVTLVVRLVVPFLLPNAQPAMNPHTNEPPEVVFRRRNNHQRYSRLAGRSNQPCPTMFDDSQTLVCWKTLELTTKRGNILQAHCYMADSLRLGGVGRLQRSKSSTCQRRSLGGLVGGRVGG